MQQSESQQQIGNLFFTSHRHKRSSSASNLTSPILVRQPSPHPTKVFPKSNRKASLKTVKSRRQSQRKYQCSASDCPDLLLTDESPRKYSVDVAADRYQSQEECRAQEQEFYFYPESQKEENWGTQEEALISARRENYHELDNQLPLAPSFSQDSELPLFMKRGEGQNALMAEVPSQLDLFQHLSEQPVKEQEEIQETSEIFRISTVLTPEQQEEIKKGEEQQTSSFFMNPMSDESATPSVACASVFQEQRVQASQSPPVRPSQNQKAPQIATLTLQADLKAAKRAELLISAQMPTSCVFSNLETERRPSTLQEIVGAATTSQFFPQSARQKPHINTAPNEGGSFVGIPLAPATDRAHYPSRNKMFLFPKEERKSKVIVPNLRLNTLVGTKKRPKAEDSSQESRAALESSRLTQRQVKPRLTSAATEMLKKQILPKKRQTGFVKSTASRYTLRKQETTNLSKLGAKKSRDQDMSQLSPERPRVRGKSGMLLLEVSGATPLTESELRHQKEIAELKQMYERKLWRANARYIRAKAESDKQREIALTLKQVLKEVQRTGARIVVKLNQEKEGEIRELRAQVQELMQREKRKIGHLRVTKRGICEHETSVQTELSEGIVEEVEENLRTERLRMPLVEEIFTDNSSESESLIVQPQFSLQNLKRNLEKISTVGKKSTGPARVNRTKAKEAISWIRSKIMTANS